MSNLDILSILFDTLFKFYDTNPKQNIISHQKYFTQNNHKSKVPNAFIWLQWEKVSFVMVFCKVKVLY